MAEDDALARVLRVAAEGSSRSPLYRWMRQHHAELDRTFAAVRPNWRALAAEFAALGILDSTGQPASPDRARKTWWRVRADIRRTQRRRAAAVAVEPVLPVASAVAAGPSPPAAAPPPGAPASFRPSFDPAEGAFDPSPKFQLKPVRPK